MNRLLLFWLLLGIGWCQIPHQPPEWFHGPQARFERGFVVYRGSLSGRFNVGVYDRQGRLVFETLAMTPDGDLADVLDLTAGR
ncbi:MAG: hypothetical protein GY953_52230, partial [bacterium]|nr:hypothetical protein [bacterium]